MGGGGAALAREQAQPAQLSADGVWAGPRSRSFREKAAGAAGQVCLKFHASPGPSPLGWGTAALLSSPVTPFLSSIDLLALKLQPLLTRRGTFLEALPV